MNNLYYFILIFIIIIILLTNFYYFNHNNKIVKENMFDSEIYMHTPTCSNNTLIYNIPTLDYIQKNTVTNVKNLIYFNHIKLLFEPYIISGAAAQENVGDWLKMDYNIQNQNTWQNRLINLNDNINISYKLEGTELDFINKCVLLVNEIIKNEFIIYKYAVSSVFVNNEIKQTQYGILFVLLQEFGFYGYTIFLKMRINKDTKKAEITQYNFVGQFFTDQLLGYSGYNKEIDNISFIDKDISFQKSSLDTSRKSDKFRCFDPVTNTVTKDINRELCVAGYDPFGRKKQVGVWDQPCKVDEDCIFFKSNINYKNKFGGCKNGYCEMPINVRRIGYTLYDTTTKPLCYNCDIDNGKKWLPISTLRNCCDKQSKNETYKSPDYAFDDDLDDRFNDFYQKNYQLKQIA